VTVQAVARAVDFARTWREGSMTAVVIALLALTGFLGTRLFSATSEIAALRTHVASLKRKLQQR
jgi:hypothetical protein